MEKDRHFYYRRTEKQDSYESLLKLADHYVSLDDYRGAEIYYEKAASLDGDLPDAYVGLGIVAMQKNDLDQAELSFRVACRLDKTCARAWNGLAKVAQKRNYFETAFEMYLRSLDADPDNLSALLGLFQSSCQMGTFAKVIYYLEVYLDMHPRDNAVKFSLSTLYFKEGQLDNAKKLLCEILAEDKDNKDAADLLEEVEHNLAQKKPVSSIL